MGCKESKLKEPSVIVGSTVIQGDSIMILDDKLLLPIRDENEKSVIEVDLKQKNFRIIRGFYGKLYSSMLKDMTIEEEKQRESESSERAGNYVAKRTNDYKQFSENSYTC